MDVDGGAFEERTTLSIGLYHRPVILVGMVTTQGVGKVSPVLVPERTHCVINLKEKG